MDDVIGKILTLITLIGGTYLCVQIFDTLVYNSGALHVLVYTLGVLMIRCGIVSIWKGKISC